MKRILSVAVLLLSTLALNAQPRICAHRGYYKSEGSWENTVDALKNAQILKGVDIVEFDVHYSSDDSLVIYHGPKVYGTDWKNIQDLTYAQIRSVLLPGDHRIPTLHEFLVQAKKTPELTLWLEIKAHPTPEREDALIADILKEIQKEDILDQILFLSFSKHAMESVKRQCPQARLVLNSSDMNEMTAAEAKAAGYCCMSYNKKVFMARPELIDEANALGMETALWMCNDEKMIDWGIEHKVTYMTSDYPEKMNNYLQKKLAEQK